MCKTLPTLESLADGDVIGFSGNGLVSDVINLATFGVPRWGLSHIGIICSYRGVRYLFESTTLGDTPCDILQRKVNGVQAHRLYDILERPGRVWKYKINKALDDSQHRALLLNLLAQLGTPYDYKGAARSGGFLIRQVGSILRRQDISKLFCSELVAFVLTKIGHAVINNASAQSPNSLARRLVRDGICLKPVRIK